MNIQKMGISCLRLIIIFILVNFVLCATILVGEWLVSEAYFQIWLRQDSRRIDFSAYDDAAELREALLTKLPLGSSEQDVRDFIIAQGYRDLPAQESVYGPFGTGMAASRAGRGLFGFRLFLFPYAWGINFEIDPVTRKLTDIQVQSQPGI